jgi:hypothetical protein
MIIPFASVGCGGVAGAPSSPGVSAPSAQGLFEFRQLALEVQSAAADYRTVSMGVASVSACQGIHDSYDAKVRPWIAAMNEASPGMDDFMNGHGAGTSADVSCVSTSMMTELDRHRAAACSSSNLADDDLEVSRHVEAMTSYDTHLEDRCDEVLGALDGGTPSWEGMMSSCGQPPRDAGAPDGMMHGNGMGMMR